MKIDYPELAEHDNRISVNDRWVEELQRYYTEAVSILVQHHKDPSDKAKGFEKIQRIQLTRRTQKGAPPREDYDEVVDVIARSCWAWLAQRHEAGEITEEEPVGFSLQVRQIVGKADQRHRVYFTVSFDGSADDPYDDPQVQAVGELERRQMWMIDSLQSQVNQQREHIAEMQQKFLDVATINSQPMESIARMMDMSGRMMGSGMSQLLSGLKLQYDEKKADAEQRESTRRTEAMVSGLKETFGPLLPMAMSILAQKMGIPADMPSPGAGPEGDDVESESVDVDDIYRTALESFEASLTDEQRLALKDSLAESERERFYAILRAKTALDVFDAMDAFIESTDMSVLGELQSVLSPEQMATIMQIYSAFAQWHNEGKPRP